MDFLRPILTCEEAAHWEEKLLGGNAEKVWDAMSRAGEAVGQAVMRDFNEVRQLPRDPHVLVLVGKGHNGGDALLATLEILRQRPRGTAVVLFPFGETTLRPHAQQALARLLQEKGDRLQLEYLDERIAGKPEEVQRMLKVLGGVRGYDFCLDGVLGMSFKPPLREPLATLFDVLNSFPGIAFRAAVDVPSGVSEQPVECAFRADFTHATGIAKTPLVLSHNQEWVGRPRYLGIGFFNTKYTGEHSGGECVLTDRCLDELRALRPAGVDKRDYGHLMIIAGSRQMPGALLMNVQAALRSGVGLVTAFAPESVAASLAAAAPEAMWVPWPETAEGTLDPAAAELFFAKADKASTVLMGSGMGDAIELVKAVLAKTEAPVVLDADALQADVLTAPRKGALVLTPHAGEFKRLGGEPDTLRDFCKKHATTLVLKGAITRIANMDTVAASPFGGPVLARGGSGDVLAGLLGGLLAQAPAEPFAQACRAVCWHGQAADALARAKGQVAVATLDLTKHLSEVLRAEKR